MGIDPPSPPPPWAALLPAEGVRAAGWNKKAVWSFICGIAGVWPFPVICSVIAVVLGYAGKKEIDRSPVAQRGRALAVAGIVLGWALGGVMVAVFVLYGIACISGPDC